MSPSPIHREALAAHEAALSIVPPKQDGTKAPIEVWKKYQQDRAELDQLDRWYSNGCTGLGAVTGRVSGGVTLAGGEMAGGLEVLEFDDRETYERFRAAAARAGLNGIVDRIEDGYLEESPSGGIHWPYRCAEIAGNTKLARRPDPGRPHGCKVLIETRGEGGFIILAPSFGTVHPSGRPYRRIRGGFDSITEITPEERADLWDLARSFDEMPDAGPEPARPAGAAGEARPGDDYATRTTWGEILGPGGWAKVYERDGVTYWRRPGKDRGVSATTGRGGRDCFYAFTSSTSFLQERSYTKFGAYALLEHGGDFAAATRALRSGGYGGPIPAAGGPAEKAGKAEKGGQKPGPADPSSASSAFSAGVSADWFDAPVPARRWPEPPGEAAWRGPAGELALAVERFTEGDPIGILVQTLVGFGNLVGRRPHFRVGATVHHLNEFACTAGPTGVGRKGTAWDVARMALAHCDQFWADLCIKGGLTSGEGLIWAVRDPIYKKEPVKEKGRVVDYQDVMVDDGVADKRLLALETELGLTLKVVTREGNTLSALIRQAWDSGTLRTMTKNNPAQATDAHISIIGHVTELEASRLLTEVDMANGFANRFLWVCVKQKRFIPRPRAIDSDLFRPVLAPLKAAADRARDVELLELDEDAEALWKAVYEGLCRGHPGLLGAILGRGVPHVMRLACLYALVDGHHQVLRPHLESALALWDYCARSAAYIFGESLGDKDADKALEAIRLHPGGLTKEQVHNDVFQKHKTGKDIDRILGRLIEFGLIVDRKVPTGGRPATVFAPAITPAEKAEEAEKWSDDPPPAPPPSPSSPASGRTLSWLVGFLSNGPARVSHVIEAAPHDGVDLDQIQSAAAMLDLVQFLQDGEAAWRLPD